MHFHLPPRQQFKILTLSALVAVLGACTSVEKVGAVATKKVNLAVTLSPPRFVTSPANLIQCVDTTRNLGPDTSTFTSVKFYLGTNTNNPASNPKLLAYGSDLNSRNVPGFSPGSSYVRSNSETTEQGGKHGQMGGNGRKGKELRGDVATFMAG